MDSVAKLFLIHKLQAIVSIIFITGAEKRKANVSPLRLCRGEFKMKHIHTNLATSELGIHVLIICHVR